MGRKGSSLKGAMWIAVAAVIIGLIFIIAGAIITGIAYTEITPPNYDDNYDRYIGSSVPRLIGPFILVFGVIIVIGSGAIMGFKGMNQKYSTIAQHSPYDK